MPKVSTTSVNIKRNEFKDIIYVVVINVYNFICFVIIEVNIRLLFKMEIIEKKVHEQITKKTDLIQNKLTQMGVLQENVANISTNAKNIELKISNLIENSLMHSTAAK
jgi:hypothetical protein